MNDWADAVFTASSMDEPFEDVTIVSTLQEFVKTAFEVAASVMYESQHKLDELHEVRQCAAILINEGKIVVQEHVTVTTMGITVCLNAPALDDDQVAYRAMTMVAEALDQLDGNHGTVKFGEPLRHSLRESLRLLIQ